MCAVDSVNNRILFAINKRQLSASQEGLCSITFISYMCKWKSRPM